MLKIRDYADLDEFNGTCFKEVYMKMLKSGGKIK